MTVKIWMSSIKKPLNAIQHSLYLINGKMWFSFNKNEIPKDTTLTLNAIQFNLK